GRGRPPPPATAASPPRPAPRTPPRRRPPGRDPAPHYARRCAVPHCRYRRASCAALLCISRGMTLVGAGAATTVIDGEQPPGQLGAGKPVMCVSTGTAVEIQGVTLKRGNFSVGSLTGHGGGIRTAGALTLTETVVSDNLTGG